MTTMMIPSAEANHHWTSARTPRRRVRPSSRGRRIALSLKRRETWRTQETPVMNSTHKTKMDKAAAGLAEPESFSLFAFRKKAQFPAGKTPGALVPPARDARPEAPSP
jgi:hypothetical protein